MAPQHRLLDGRGEQTIPRHTNTLATTTDILLEMKRRFPGLKAGIYTAKALVLGPPSQHMVFRHTGGVLDATAVAEATP